MNKEDGGQAFPYMDDIKTYPVRAGMSMRDYFAARALQGLCANPGGPFQASMQSGWALTNCNEGNVAGTAYAMADAMLAARNAG